MEEIKDCPCCTSNLDELCYLTMTLVEGLGWQCYQCGYTEAVDGK